jgi:hypothetical protein
VLVTVTFTVGGVKLGDSPHAKVYPAVAAGNVTVPVLDSEIPRDGAAVDVVVAVVVRVVADVVVAVVVEAAVTWKVTLKVKELLALAAETVTVAVYVPTASEPAGRTSNPRLPEVAFMLASVSLLLTQSSLPPPAARSLKLPAFVPDNATVISPVATSDGFVTALDKCACVEYPAAALVKV